MSIIIAIKMVPSFKLNCIKKYIFNYQSNYEYNLLS